MQVSRRGVLRGGAVGAGVLLLGSLTDVFGSTASGAPGTLPGPGPEGYGPLVPDPGGLLDLPEGFSYKVLSREGETLARGGRVPGKHDGMGAFPHLDRLYACVTRPTGGTVLVRNHEQRPGAAHSAAAAVQDPSWTYDPAATGGTTNVVVDGEGNETDSWVSLAGTAVNCAGGKTPWGTWLTCEETEDRAGTNGYTEDHGFVFEVDPELDRALEPVPLTAMGRFPHEAVAVDPASGTVYLTEDASGPNGLCYRFVPRVPLGGPRSLREGGTLSAMSVPGTPDLTAVTTPGTVLTGVRWVPVPDPLAATTSTRRQFSDSQVTRAPKLEGCWFAEDAWTFVSSYHRGAVNPHAGQVWRYRPADETLELVLVLAPGGRFDSPDNVTVSPYGGGLVVAEDGLGENYLMGATEDGATFPVARNAAGSSEFAGVGFSDDARTLYANVQTPGTTFAITGPWSGQSGQPR